MRKQTKHVRTRTKTVTELVMTQLVVAPWDGENGRTYSLLGLSDAGRVYRKDGRDGAWIALDMTTESL